MKSMRRAALLLSIPVALGALGAWALNSGREAGLVAQAARLERGQILATFNAAGLLVYGEQARLSPEVLARVDRVFVHEGQAVRRGQPLIQLERVLLDGELQQAAAQLAQAELDRRRAERALQSVQARAGRENELWRQGMIAAERHQDAQLALDNAQLDLESTRVRVAQLSVAHGQRQLAAERSLIRSPLDGVVVGSSARAGETAVPSVLGMSGSELMVVANPASLQVEVQLAEQDLARVRPGQAARVRLTAWPDQVLAARVLLVGGGAAVLAPTAGANKGREARTVRVRLSLEMAGRPGLAAGMGCEVELLGAGSERALKLPLVALRHREESRLASMEAAAFGSRREPIAWVLVRGRAEARKLVLGLADAHHQEVLSGLGDEDLVLTGPPALLDGLREGEAVRVGP